MSKLEDEKTKAEVYIKELQNKHPKIEITEDIIKKVISSFQTSIKEKNIVECKKFIQHYVDKVLVFSDRVEVVYRIDISLLKGIEGYTVLSGKSIKKIKKDGRNIA